MSSKMLKPGLYSVGVLNPNMRVFDIVMRTDYGTSYNSYIVKDEKTALIETCHKTFFDEYLQNIREVTELEDIDYIVLSHTEPDHSGALAELTRLCPKAKIVCTKAASIYLKNITNNEAFDAMTVKDGDVISLGGVELKFILAPFLHWPDTMFTYIEKLSSVVTCDFLGAHYCEPRMLDTLISYPEKYKSARKEYYNAIMSPFKPYVLAGIEKLEKLDFDMALTSHGPVITKGGLLDESVALYKEWSQKEERDYLLVPIFYCSAYGYTENLAYTAKKTIAELLPSARVNVYNIIEHDICELTAILNASDAFMIGSPTINKDAVPPIWELLSHVDAINNQKKPAGVFGSFGWSGEAVSSIAARLNGLRIKVVGEGFRCNFTPSETDLAGMREYTTAFVSEIKA